jgi:2-polyprenyl-3-methyl-5-hydroxy-6-metoxy-1,4-benzoquinol methylase
MLSENFANTGKSFASKIEILKSYKPSGHVLDFGASWGYGSWQIQQAGYRVEAFEIDAVRANYGAEKLGLSFSMNWHDLKSTGRTFDIIFTSHVLEHLPSLNTIFSDFATLLSPGGLLIIFVPNSTGVENRTVFQRKKSFAFGEKHTFAFTADFFIQNLPKYGFTLLNVDVQPHGVAKPNLIDGNELLVVAVRDGSPVNTPSNEDRSS